MPFHEVESVVIPVVVLLGPTAVGKTEIAILLAERLEGEIVSADSRMFYRGMDIGTAKPTLKERQRVPHHLIDVAEPDLPWNLATFQERARQALFNIRTRGRLPFLVGGTGQYLRAVIQNWQLPKVEPDQRLRNALEAWAEEIGQQGLHDRLAALDPQAASAIDPRNLRRTVRALEVIFCTGRPFSEQRLQSISAYQVCLIGLTRPRPELYDRIDRRIETMLESGLVAEVQGLLERGLSPELPVFSAIGYREIIAFLQGKMNLEQAEIEIKRSTRILVRRQANWFKAQDPSIRWFDLSETNPSNIEAFIHHWIESIQTPMI